MKRFFMVCLSLISVGLTPAQNFPQFDKLFEDSTLRIDYIHSGNAVSEKFEIKKFIKHGIWSGSRKYLIDNFNNGTYYVKVYDSTSGAVIYSKGFDSYFKEYQTSRDAINGLSKSFEEVILIPFPKIPVKLAIEKTSTENITQKIYSIDINPVEINAGSLGVDHSNTLIIESHKGGEAHSKVDVVILGEGYTKEESTKFEKDIAHFTEIFFSLNPYKSMKEYFNIYGVLVPSQESGIDEPRANIYKNTSLDASFNALGSERYMLTESVHKVYDAASAVPFDAVYIMANHKRYGGGGIYNFYATFTSDTQFRDYIFLHEFGHSFAGLADEYYTSDVAYSDFYKPDREPTEANITALLNSKKLKWGELVEPSTPVPTPWNKAEFDSMDYAWQKQRAELNNEISEMKKNNAPPEEIKAAEENYDRLDKEQSERVDKYLKENEHYGKVGAFEGAGYMQFGLYRSMLDCIMFSKGVKPFCAVCQNAIRDVILHYSED
ncbi:MAG: M64 family metallopeptidase [Ignavibacterium sp.]|nr:M64 family metallopeptidase [Ignavibacterium sp.]